MLMALGEPDAAVRDAEHAVLIDPANPEMALRRDVILRLAELSRAQKLSRPDGLIDMRVELEIMKVRLQDQERMRSHQDSPSRLPSPEAGGYLPLPK
jgi:hypothetical protein